MMFRKLFFLLFIPTLFFAQTTDNYYAGIENLTGYALKSKLHEIISKSAYSWNYDSDLPDLYKSTDLDKYYEANNSFLDIYTENPTGAEKEFFPTDANVFIGSASAEGMGLNKEHIIPQSTFNSEYPMYSDMHFVIPADARINQLRNYYPYGISKTNKSDLFYSFTNGSMIGNRANPGTDYKGRVYEPIAEFRGDIARMIFYFIVRYEGKLSSFKYNVYYSTITQDQTTDVSTLDGTEEHGLDNWFLAQLLQWNQDDPVSQKERDRNNEVFKIQKNKNPFIDNPNLANLIWNQTPDNVAPNAPANLNIAKTGANFLTLNWSDSTSSDVIGYKIYVNGVLTDATNKTSITLDHLTPSTTYNITVKAYDNGYLYSSDSNPVSGVTLSSDSYAKDLMITKYIEGTTSSTTNVFNNAIEITNKTGHDVNLNNYKISIQNYNYTNGNYYFSQPYQLEGTVADGEVFVVINPEAQFTCYNVSQAKFVTAAPSLMYTGSQYLELSYNGNTVDAVGTKNTLNTNNNVSLYRLPSVNQPNSTFNLSGEWQSNAMNYCDGLGSLSANDVNLVAEKLSIYPNPASEFIKISGKNIHNIAKAQIFDLSGKLVLEINNPFRTADSIGVSMLNTGNYILKIDNKTFRFIKK